MNIDDLLKLIRGQSDYLAHNDVLLQIYKGQLLPFIKDALRQQLSGQALEIALQRIPPINVLRRIIDKESKIYATGVTRSVAGGTEADESLLGWFTEQISPNETFGRWNARFNLFANGLVQPYLRTDGKPAVRVIPSDRFIPFSDDAVDPQTPTGFIIIMGSFRDSKGPYTKYLAIDKDEFVYFTNRGTKAPEYIYRDVNPLNRLPFVYINRDPDKIMPTQDSDILAMTLLIPVILTDINYAHMFQAFSIIYGINVTDKGIKWGPNAFWTFESPEGDERQPQLGTLQPSADIAGGLQLVANQFALWLNTKGIKPGAIGEVNGTNFNSGISKILDEMDTSENRNEQIPYFAKGEAQFWDLTLNHMLPYWQTYQGYTGIRQNFSASARVITNFAEQVPLVRRGQVLEEVGKEMNLRLTTRSRALKRLNPQMSAKEIQMLEEELDEEYGTEEDPTDDKETGNGFGSGKSTDGE